MTFQGLDFRATRRDVLAGAGAAALVVAFRLGMPPAAAAAPGEFAPNAFLRIAPDSTVTVICKHLEMGQGVTTGLLTIVAEELDADWAQLKAEFAPADGTRYANTAFGAQGTGGSTSIGNSYEQLRQAGATARAMLVAAAAAEWSVPPADVSIERGQLRHLASGRTATFGALAARAAALPVPAEAAVKPAADWKLVGTRLPRKDNADKIRGRAKFTIDMALPGMLTAVLARPPRFGGTVKSFDATAARAVPGVVDVVAVPRGVAVLANGFWPAKLGRDALTVEWDEAAAETRSSAELVAEYRALAERPGASAAKRGDAAAGLGGAAKTVEATFEFPYLAHAPLEPLGCVVRLSPDLCEVWSGCQFPAIDHPVAAAVSGLPPEKVVINTLYAGGSFGRRATPDADVTAEAVSIARAIGGRAPVKLLWTREDDVAGGRYRPIFVHKVRAGIDAAGRIAGWHQVIVGQSIMAGTSFEQAMTKDGVDQTSVEGAHNMPYAIDDFDVSLHTPKVGVPVLWWRSVGHTHTGYVAETIMDELAEAAGADPVAFRLAHLVDRPRHTAALKLAAEKANWGAPVPEGVARGVALCESFDTMVAQIVDVRLAPDGGIKVERVVAAVECGLVINPDIVAAQIEGGVGFGLSAMLHGAITLDGGQVQQSNFHDYPPLRIGEMPRVEVHIVPSTGKPTGVGEPGVPPIAPAVANAVRRLTKTPVRVLPYSGAAGRA